MVAPRDKTLTTRWAVYWAPRSGHALWQAGGAWLGRDADDPLDRPEAVAPRALSAGPRRYGLHATLKAPLRLRDGEDPAEFLQAVRELARAHRRFELPRLQVAELDGFLALRPVQEPSAPHPLRRLADACVRELDAWRAPPGDTERARRLAAVAGDPQLHELLLHWGYPYVLSRWRFHLTLTDPLPAEDPGLRLGLLAHARSHFAPALREPLVFDSVCVFVEPAPGRPFELRHRFDLAD